MNKFYTIKLKDGAFFTGTEEDVARWYCNRKKISLYVTHDEQSPYTGINGKTILLAERYNENVPDGDEIFHVSSFEGLFTSDFETGYYLFFTDYIANPKTMKEESYTLIYEEGLTVTKEDKELMKDINNDPVLKSHSQAMNNRVAELIKQHGYEVERKVN